MSNKDRKTGPDGNGPKGRGHLDSSQDDLEQETGLYDDQLNMMGRDNYGEIGWEDGRDEEYGKKL